MKYLTAIGKVISVAAKAMNKSNLMIPLSIILSGILVSASIIYSGRSNLIATVSQQEVAGQQAQDPKPSGPQKVSADDDPVLGDKNAPVTLIEFSDYECPFCKRHFQNVLPQLIEEYVDSGKLKIVYRDLPLSFHDPLATQSALAANCAREQGGDLMYFDYHDELFNSTASNGRGLSFPEDHNKIAAELGLNATQFQSCLNSDKYDEEIANDLVDASAAGANGTPSFFVGKSSDDGIIEGVNIVGAQPFSAFQTQIDKLLSE